MTVQITKTYRGISPEMLHDELRSLVQKQGVMVSNAKLQTYSLPSGATQSRVTLVLKTQAEREADQKECGSAHIISSPMGETKMMLDLDEKLLPQERISSFQADLDFILSSYEVKW